MAQAQQAKGSSGLSSCDAYFERVKSRKKLPQELQETLTDAFARIPVSSFPQVPGGKGDDKKNYCICKLCNYKFIYLVSVMKKCFSFLIVVRLAISF